MPVTDADDILPDASREDTVRRKTGNSVFAEAGAAFYPIHSLELKGLYDFQQKDPDWFDGDRGWDYGLLSQDTGPSNPNSSRHSGAFHSGLVHKKAICPPP